MEPNMEILSESSEDEVINLGKRKRKENPPPKKKAKRELALGAEELINSICENGEDFVFILSLSGKMISEESTKKEMRSAYRKLSKVIHPDRNGNSKESTNAFQSLATAFETLTNPDAGAPKEREKDKRFTRGNEGCYITKIHCPRCKSRWDRDILGLEKPSFNFFMSGLKQYICGLCCMKFGCLTGQHFTPCCKKQFVYDPDSYDEKVECSMLQGEKKTKKQQKCKQKFGFHRYKVSERREKEIRVEVKKTAEKERKKREGTKRRKARLDRRNPVQKLTSAAEETLFVIGLTTNCPRCGWELMELKTSAHKEKAKVHLEYCADAVKIKAYQKKKKELREAEEKRKAEEQLAADLLVLKSWESNGRQVGQLWLLPESQLRTLCEKNDLKTKGEKPDMIKRLYKHLKKTQALAITDGSELKTGGRRVKYDFCGIEHVDQEDLPENLHSMELDELQCVCAGYNIPYRKRDTKSDLLTKLEKKRYKGILHPLMIKG